MMRWRECRLLGDANHQLRPIDRFAPELAKRIVCAPVLIVSIAKLDQLLARITRERRN
jgi:hypothetical protein